MHYCLRVATWHFSISESLIIEDIKKIGDRMDKTIIREKIDLLGKAFEKVFDFKNDEEFLKRIAGLDEVNKEKVLRFKKWDWIHGVGLYGYWKIYEFTKDKTYFQLLETYYEERTREGLPEKNINSVCPLLVDRETGLWYHGWTFEKGHNFAKALWARGNCWITIAIPELIEITNMEDGAVKRFLVEALKKQVHALKNFQDDSGLWYTIINEKDNYVEASGSAGCAYGILKAINAGLIEDEYLEVAVKPLEKLIGFIDQEGLVHQVSIGTPMGETVEFYKQIGIEPMPYGQALMMLYLIELLK